MESLAFSIPQKVLDRLASETYQEICLAWGVNIELNKLKDTLETTTIVLVDAEVKQIEDRKISHWLGKLKDVCYDADDVLDDYDYQKLRMQVLKHASIKEKVHNFFSSRNSLIFHAKMAHRIKDVRERLVEIAYEKNQFSLLERARDLHGVHIDNEAHSHVKASIVIGRDDDRKKIINHLLNDFEEHNVCVISIVGIGGLGKTTLAKIVYSDTRVVEKFRLRKWVCVSDNFDIKRLVCDIIGTKYGDNNLDQLQIKLGNVLRDKKFLLVLDDVWDTEPMGITSAKWSDLKTLLDVGAKGSKIIVTTRSDTVASLMGSIIKHPLQGLPYDDCMSLFMKVAFLNGEEELYPHLKKIAQEIVKNCGGVPLALTTVGSLLCLKREVQDWLDVRDNEIWKLEQGDDDILPALRLSYDALPFYLKPCFAYCSLFPKGYEFDSRDLLSKWMAEGILESSSKWGNQGFEEIGFDYIRQLCSRYFFQKTSERPMIYVSFKMHDLVHDLAISVTQVECSSMNFRPASSKASERVRHLSLSSNDFETSSDLVQLPESLLKLRKVRSVLIPDSLKSGLINQSFIEACISRFKYIRIFDLKFVKPKVLPSSIGKLSHLRYLNLSGCEFMKRLPHSICKLQNLQVLILYGCNSLEELPKDIGKLISLLHLEITTKEMYLPKGIRCLTSLQVLWVGGCENLKSLGEGIQCLTNLRKLIISSCGNLESFPVNMKKLTKLHSLSIRACSKLDLKSGEGIRNLRYFYIADQELETLPNWLQDCASTLQILGIIGPNLSVLPEWFQNLSVLQRLMIVFCFRLYALPEGMHHLTALRELEIDSCSELLMKRCREGGEDWSKICHVPNIRVHTTASDMEMPMPF